MTDCVQYCGDDVCTCDVHPRNFQKHESMINYELQRSVGSDGETLKALCRIPCGYGSYIVLGEVITHRDNRFPLCNSYEVKMHVSGIRSPDVHFTCESTAVAALKGLLFEYWRILTNKEEPK